jgi:hypothetical protein
MVGQIRPPRSSDDAERNSDTVHSRQLLPRTDTRGHVIRTTTKGIRTRHAAQQFQAEPRRLETVRGGQQ